MKNLNKKILILVVEDEDILAKTMKEKLVSEGFEVEIAYDGLEGFSLAVEKHPDLILLDILLPKMDGMSVLRRLRGDEWGKTVPVIILTNLSSADEKRNRDITELEPSYFFVKTDKSLEEIVEKVKDRLGIIN